MPDWPYVPAWKLYPAALPERVVWDTLERDPANHPRTVADYLNRTTGALHIIWNPVTGETVRMLPPGPVIRIGVIARAARPFTDGPCVGLCEIVDWLRDLDIPEVWPAGPPMHPEVDGNRDMAIWRSQAGHFGGSQVPGGTGKGPGAIDIRRLFGRACVDIAGDRAQATRSDAGTGAG